MSKSEGPGELLCLRLSAAEAPKGPQLVCGSCQHQGLVVWGEVQGEVQGGGAAARARLCDVKCPQECGSLKIHASWVVSSSEGPELSIHIWTLTTALLGPVVRGQHWVSNM
uniref:Uncharacterized protein n=1 Tax=Knipowitschia caucasica TaxID=637954 RepID=A0AAV2IRZ0_KNICA